MGSIDADEMIPLVLMIGRVAFRPTIPARSYWR